LHHTQCAQKAGFQHTSLWYLGNNICSGWCGNYTLYERGKFSLGIYWLHHVIGRPVHRLRENWLFGASDGHLQRETIPGAVLIQFDLLMMSTTLLETCRGL